MCGMERKRIKKKGTNRCRMKGVRVRVRVRVRVLWVARAFQH